MKLFLFSLILAPAFAVASPSQIDTTAVVATVEGYEDGVKMVALLADGRMQVVPSQGRVKTIQLSESAAGKLFALAKKLSGVELNIIEKRIRCRMMLRPSLNKLSVANFDKDSKTFVKPTSLVLTPKSCAVAREVFPADPKKEKVAQELRSSLAVLGLAASGSKTEKP